MIPKISIITISFNSEKTIEETIISIIGQNYQNFEYVIIDGGSKDHTLDIINRYKEQIDVIVSEPDNGISDAFNKGIMSSTGEIVGIINSDDILLPGALQMVADSYDPEVDVYSGNVIFWNDKTGDTMISKPELDFSTLKLQYGVAHPGRFVSRRAYERFGNYDVRLRYNMDVDLLCRFFQNGAIFIHIDNELAKFRMGATTSDSIYKKKEDYRIFVDNYGGSENDFRWIWRKAVIKYWMIQLSTFLFGERFRYKLVNNNVLKCTILPIINKIFS